MGIQGQESGKPDKRGYGRPMEERSKSPDANPAPSIVRKIGRLWLVSLNELQFFKKCNSFVDRLSLYVPAKSLSLTNNSLFSGLFIPRTHNEVHLSRDRQSNI